MAKVVPIIRTNMITKTTRDAIDKESHTLMWGNGWEKVTRYMWKVDTNQRGLKAYRIKNLVEVPHKKAFHTLTSAKGYKLIDPFAIDIQCIEKHKELGNLMRSIDDFYGIKREFYTLDRKNNVNNVFTSKSIEDAESAVVSAFPTAHLTFALSCRPARLDDTLTEIITSYFVDFAVDTPIIENFINEIYGKILKEKIDDTFLN
ncbi:hypothetical protein TetV_416 [Tetraselmis virus 1]|uniref:Uncharacterized protein n=1 Tax=Tetraselmis virus 1 TaxID=2060617 RepID=A0A2P0VNL9_9VIRU|nr:hypothetical protein QJ968_gp638 [Tetraselmis virus 1]AUF82498.1 hypothetical protein TetV_416 [Tetraselmis virus 1]